MFHSRTHQRIAIQTDGVAGPYLLVASDQVFAVKDVLERADVPCQVTEDAVSLGGERSDATINLGHVQPEDVQPFLDAAAVRVAVRFVNGDTSDYYDGQELAERYEDLKQQGLEGRSLVHELLTDDWGAPPIAITLEGKLKNGRFFRETTAYS